MSDLQPSEAELAEAEAEAEPVREAAEGTAAGLSSSINTAGTKRRPDGNRSTARGRREAARRRQAELERAAMPRYRNTDTGEVRETVAASRHDQRTKADPAFERDEAARPSGSAPKSDWVDYATALGVEQADDLTVQQLKDATGAEDPAEAAAALRSAE